MPIHDLGYRAWPTPGTSGRLMPAALRFWVIAQVGMALAWRNRWIRRLLLTAWLPALYMGGVLFAFEQAMGNAEDPRQLAMALTVVDVFPETETEALKEALLSGDPAVARHGAWAWLLLMFFRFPQGLLMALVIGLIAPPLVARDVHSRAFLLYFSRPLTRVEYILGKLTVICGYVLMVTTLPALALYLVGVLLSPPEVAVVATTWDLPLRILAASAVLMLPTATLALAFSSLTTRTFYASFAWFATWLLGVVAYMILWVNLATARPAQLEDGFSSQWTLLSLYHTLGRVQTWIFGLEKDFADVVPSMLLLTAITVVSLVVLFRRVSSPMRI